VKIRITGVPPGEAPLWVREKWVGLELSTPMGAITTPTMGVLSRPPTFIHKIWDRLFRRYEIVTGYVVNARHAVDRLSAVSPEAAAWWRENTREMLAADEDLVFHDTVSELILANDA
jgi:hypothetical protein